MQNPFIDSINIPDEFFCDRDAETRQLIDNITSSVNTVLYAPRRVGKSSLINHVLRQKEISDNYNTLYVDILGTRDVVGFVEEFQKALLSASFAKGMSMSQIFTYLESTAKPTIVVFDEFQKIEKYVEPMAEILRSEIQKLRRTRFIFSGSETHMLSIMFNNRNKPFFSSARDMSIGVIPLDKYIEYCKRMFGLYGKDITEEAVALVYYTFSGITRPNQDIMRVVFHNTAEGKTAGRADVERAIKELIISKEISIRTELSGLPANAHKLFRLIAANGILENPTSSKKLTELSQSQVQHMANRYTSEEYPLLLKVGKNSLKISDKLMELFILGPDRLAERLSCSKAIFEREQQLSQTLPSW